MSRSNEHPQAGQRLNRPGRNARRFGAMVSLLAIAGSAGFADAAPREKLKSMDSYATASTFAAPAKDWPSDRWWDSYNDPQLSGLIDEALAGAPDLKIAQARIRKAGAIAMQSGAALLPSLDAGAYVSDARFSSNPGLPLPSGWNVQGQAGLLFNWELDFWGKNRAALAAATSEAKAAQAEGAEARLALSSAVASAYADLEALYADEDTARDAVKVRTQTATLMRGRFGQGLETDGAARRAESARATAEAELAQIDESIGLTRVRIAALMGAGPDRGLAIARPDKPVLTAFGLPSDLRADLIGRRPDVIAARLRAEAAAKRIKVAKAAFYPNVNLLALAGVQTFGLSNLIRSGSTAAGIGPAVSLPIFNGGRLKGQLRGAEADYAAAVAEYDGAVTRALQDVAEATTSSKALSLRLAKTEEAEEAATAAWQVESNRYRGGLATYLEVLNAEDAMIAARRETAGLKTRAFSLDVMLVHALGGGFRSAPPAA
jgi:NodT family efflux transporter outer membrane factor (OMF) lipoprotein